MTIDNPTVNPIGRAVVGVPEPCPLCGGELDHCYGFRFDDEGRGIPFIDPTVARCRDCWKTFPIRAE